MKIYRMLNEREYEQFEKNRNIRYMSANLPELAFPENRENYTGKYFFFTLEDVFTFANTCTNCNPTDNILELDIDKNTAFKYLCAASYMYVDPTICDKIVKSHHSFVEVYLPYAIVDEKLKNGEYRILDHNYCEGFRPITYEKQRNPKIIKLAHVLTKIQALNYHIWCGTKDERTISEKEKRIMELKHVFNDFARAHENYCLPAPIEERKE